MNPTASRIVERLLGEVVGQDLSREQILVLVRVLKKHGALGPFADRLSATPASTAGDWRMRFELAWVLHRQPEAAESMARAVRADPSCAVTALAAVEFFMAARDQSRAIALVDVGLTHTPKSRPLLRLRAILSSYVRPANADEDIMAAWKGRLHDWWVVLDCWARIGRYDRIDDALEELRALHPHDPTVHTALGRMALWRGDTAAAAALAQTALDAEAANREAPFVLGAVAVLKGQYAEAMPLLDAAIDGTGRIRWLAVDAALAFKACALRGLQQYEQGKQTASKAMFKAQDYNVAAHIARLTNSFYTHRRLVAINPRFMEVASQVHDLVGDPQTAWTGDPKAFIDGMAEVEQRLAGNRSSLSSWVDDRGELQRHTVPPYPRNLGRLTQMLIRVRSPDAVRVEFDRLVAQHPNDPTVFTYRGEFQIWMGDYAGATADFETALALDKETTWAWIGMAAAQMGTGQLHRALDTLAEGIVTVKYEGPTVFVYRGETRRLLGELDAAAADLKQATDDKPQRLSAWINRALVAEAQGNDAPTAVLSEAIAATNPGFWHDVRQHEAGAERPLEACLALMRGNRSSTVLTYRTATGTVRLANWQAHHASEALKAAFEDA